MKLLKTLLIAALAALSLAAGAVLPGTAWAKDDVAADSAAKESAMTDPKIAVVEKMIDAWNRRDWKMVGDLFAEDGVLHSMMIEPVNGRPAIAERINALGAGIESITLHIHNIGRIGDVVVIERTDDGVPYGRPEITLLYKAKHADRARDRDDFAAVLPLLQPRECPIGTALRCPWPGLQPAPLRVVAIDQTAMLMIPGAGKCPIKQLLCFFNKQLFGCQILLVLTTDSGFELINQGFELNRKLFVQC